jgi:hypothetical protein
MQMHANALMMSITVVVFHGMMWLRGRLQAEHRTSYDHTRFIAMIAGAGLGAGIYFVFNVLPVGGMSVFLNNLVDERGGTNLGHYIHLPNRVVFVGNRIDFIGIYDDALASQSARWAHPTF